MQQYEEIIKRTWTDESFKNKFINDPKAVLAEYGHDLGDIEIEVHDDTSDTMHFVLWEEGAAKATNLDQNPTLGKVMLRAYEDAEFKKRLLSDAGSAVQEVLGTKPPASIQVHENSNNKIHIVLPANPDSTGELSDADLSLVAGGKEKKAAGEKKPIDCGKIGGVISKGGAATSAISGSEEFQTDDIYGKIGSIFKSLGSLLTGGANLIGTISDMFNKGDAEAETEA